MDLGPPRLQGLVLEGSLLVHKDTVPGWEENSH